MALLRSATKGNAVGESITSALYPLENPDRRTDAPPPRYREGPRPKGGFLWPTVAQLLMSWQAYKQGRIPFQALRGYWFLPEMIMRRCRRTPGTRIRYQLLELQEGLDIHLRQAKKIREALLEAGLVVTWTEDDLQLITQPDGLPWLDRHAYAAMRAKIDRKLSRVPL